MMMDVRLTCLHDSRTNPTLDWQSIWLPRTRAPPIAARNVNKKRRLLVHPGARFDSSKLRYVTRNENTRCSNGRCNTTRNSRQQKNDYPPHSLLHDRHSEPYDIRRQYSGWNKRFRKRFHLSCDWIMTSTRALEKHSSWGCCVVAAKTVRIHLIGHSS